MTLQVGRLKRRSDFLRVARRGRKWAAPGLVLQASRRPQEARSCGEIGPRVGFTVSRKVGNAVQRNRARRRLKAAADQVLPQRARPGEDYVIIGRPATLIRPFGALVGDLELALARLTGDGSGRKE